MAYRGKFVPKNPQKYKGDYKKIVYRSLWERKYMIKCDTDPRIIQWSSEEIVIPYRCDTDGLIHRYYMDFWVKLSKPNAKGFTEMLIEVKPFSQTQDPTINHKTGRKKKLTKRVISEAFTYTKNLSKWRAARKLCKRMNLDFIVMTEYGLGIKSKK